MKNGRKNSRTHIKVERNGWKVNEKDVFMWACYDVMMGQQNKIVPWLHDSMNT